MFTGQLVDKKIFIIEQISIYVKDIKKTAAQGVRFADEEPAKKVESDEEVEFSREILSPNEKVDKLVKVYWSRKRD